MAQMTDAQMMTLALAIVFPLSMPIYSNSKITDAKETLRAENATLRAETALSFKRLKNLIEKNHSEVMTKISDLERRVGQLEHAER